MKKSIFPTKVKIHVRNRYICEGLLDSGEYCRKPAIKEFKEYDQEDGETFSTYRCEAHLISSKNREVIDL